MRDTSMVTMLTVEQAVALLLLKAALLGIDPQTAFCGTVKGGPGNLPTDYGHEVMPVLNKLAAMENWDVRAYTKDWHPPIHISFNTWHSKYAGSTTPYFLTPDEFRSEDPSVITLEAVNAGLTYQDVLDYLEAVGGQMLWVGQHAVQGTRDAEPHPDLISANWNEVILKGMDLRCDSYGACGDNGSDMNDPARKGWTRLPSLLETRKTKVVFVGGLVTEYCVFDSIMQLLRLGYTVVLVIDAARPLSLDTEPEALQKLVNAGSDPDIPGEVYFTDSKTIEEAASKLGS